MPFAIGGATSAALLFYTLVVVESYSVPFGALHWWVARLALEGAQGVAAVFAIKVVTPEGHGVDAVGIWILAGLFAPQLVRKIRFGDPAGAGFAIDLQDLFDRLVLPLRDRIDGASAGKQSHADRRLAEKLIASRVTPVELADYLISVIQRRRALETRADAARYIRETSASIDSIETRMLVLIEQARILRILWTVRQFARVNARQRRRRS